MRERRLVLTLEFRNDALRQCLSQLDSPLIERIDIPDRTLREYGMFVERYQLSQVFRCQPIGENRVRRPVAFEDTMRRQPVRCAFSFHLLRRLPESERL